MSNSSWYVITGGPSTGKTTLLEELAKRGYKTIPEVARVVIDEGIAAGNTLDEIRGDEQLFQEEVARRKADLEKRLQPNDTLFLDRGMQDTLAYMRIYDYPIAPWLLQLCEGAHYKTVFLLEPVGDFTQDYARTEDAFTRERLQKLLEMAYTEYGMEPVRVPAMSPSSRADFILSNIKKKEIS